MKRLLLLSLLLAGCAPVAKADLITSWGTHFVFDDVKTETIHEELYTCMRHVAEGCQKCYGEPEDTPSYMKDQIQQCDEIYWEKIKISDDPPTFYGMSSQGRNPDPYMEFVLCQRGLSSSMWDLPEEMTADQFSSSIYDCLALYPN